MIDPVDETQEALLVTRLAAKVRRDTDLMPLTTYRVGGPARLLIEVSSDRDLCELAEITARNTAPSCSRTCFCWCGGKTEMMRWIVSVASTVCSVESTMWPVSAAFIAVSIVS